MIITIDAIHLLGQFYVVGAESSTNFVRLNIYENSTNSFEDSTLVYTRDLSAIELFANSVITGITSFVVDSSKFYFVKLTGMSPAGQTNHQIDINMSTSTGSFTFSIGRMLGAAFYTSVSWGGFGQFSSLVNSSGVTYERLHPNYAIVQGLPAKPINPTPSDAQGYIDGSGDIELSWENAAWSKSYATTKYDIYFGNPLVLKEADIPRDSLMSYIIANASLDPTENQWRVDGKNAFDEVAVGDIWTFILATEGELDSIVNRANYDKSMRIWLSEVSNYNGFKAGSKDSDSFDLVVPTTNEARWIEALDSMILGTSGDEWRVGSSKLDTPITPTNFNILQQSSFGSAQIQALKVNETILFVDRYGRKLREMTFNESSAKFTAPDLTVMAEHITKAKIKWMCHQKSPYSILWCGLEDGNVIGFVYDREQNITAWFNATMDCFVMSGCVVPGATQDILWLSMNRVIGSADVTHIERMAEFDFDADSDAFFVDCGIIFNSPGGIFSDTQNIVQYEGQEVTYENQQVMDYIYTYSDSVPTITGLGHLEGETVSVLGDGVALDDEIVSSGQVTAHLSGIETRVLVASVGLSSATTIQPMRIVLPDSMGKNTRVNKLVISFMNTGAAKYGKSLDNMFSIDFNKVGLTNTCDIAGLFTGEVEVETAGGFDPLNPIYIQSDGPYPITVRAIIAEVDRT